jgi:hypothetical protein
MGELGQARAHCVSAGESLNAPPQELESATPRRRMVAGLAELPPVIPSEVEGSRGAALKLTFSDFGPRQIDIGARPCALARVILSRADGEGSHIWSRVFVVV